MQAVQSFGHEEPIVDTIGIFSQDAVIASMMDPTSRSIVMATMEHGKMVEEIKAETGIPLSTCYRKVAELIEHHLLVVERMVMTPAGKKYAIYRSAIEGVHIDVGAGSLTVTVKPNAEAAAKLQSAWLKGRLEAK